MTRFYFSHFIISLSIPKYSYIFICSCVNYASTYAFSILSVCFHLYNLFPWFPIISSFHDNPFHHSPFTVWSACHIPFKHLIPVHSIPFIPIPPHPLIFLHHATSQYIQSNPTTSLHFTPIPRNPNPVNPIPLHSIHLDFAISRSFTVILLHPNPFNTIPLHPIQSVKSCHIPLFFSHPATSLSTRSNSITFCSFTTTLLYPNPFNPILHISFNRCNPATIALFYPSTSLPLGKSCHFLLFTSYFHPATFQSTPVIPASFPFNSVLFVT